MGAVTIRTLRPAELAEFRAFCEAAWGKPHPLIHNPDLFDYYYRAPDGSLRFAVAADESGLLSVCGWLPASSRPDADLWLSFLVSKKGAPPALSLRLIEFIRSHTGCRTIGCNNIRPKTRALYEFFGFTVGEMTQYYRINDSISQYTICKIAESANAPLETAGAAIRRLEGPAELAEFDFEGCDEDKPHKDRAYFQKRYFDNPWLRYQVYALDEGGKPAALLVLRLVGTKDAAALRVVDFLGSSERIPCFGPFLDRLMRQCGAQFADWYAFGVPDALMYRAGFLPRRKDSPNILPNYLEPPLMENVDFTLFTSDPEGYRMFKADGDQDRANLG